MIRLQLVSLPCTSESYFKVDTDAAAEKKARSRQSVNASVVF
jgi:hypothetical protein